VVQASLEGDWESFRIGTMPKLTIPLLLRKVEVEVRSKAQFHMTREGLFRGVLKGAFIKAYEFVRYSHDIKPESASEGSFFATSALRGICEDLIALKFLRQLTKKDRDEVTTIKLLIGTIEASTKQAEFFKKRRPFQPVLQFGDDPSRLVKHKNRLTAIGNASQLWKTEGKLPPIEQMAIKVNLRWLYDFIYSATSEVVHFNPRIALRSGWGPCPLPAHHPGEHFPRSGVFSTKNFCRYYLDFNSTYGLFMFLLFALSFRKDLALSDSFIGRIKKMQTLLDDELRWPEALTYEEMNQQDPGLILRAALRVMHEERREKKRGKTSGRGTTKRKTRVELSAALAT
jgi:hypothetical protein